MVSTKRRLEYLIIMDRVFPSGPIGVLGTWPLRFCSHDIICAVNLHFCGHLCVGGDGERCCVCEGRLPTRRCSMCQERE